MDLKTKYETKVDEEIDAFNGEFEMEESEEERYLGDLITSDGSNKTKLLEKERGMALLKRLWKCCKKFHLVTTISLLLIS